MLKHTRLALPQIDFGYRYSYAQKEKDKGKKRKMKNIFFFLFSFFWFLLFRIFSLFFKELFMDAHLDI